MDVNKFKILRKFEDREVVFPITNNWDFANRGDSIDAYEVDVIKEIIGLPVDYEVSRFENVPINGDTSITHNFYFYNTGTTTYDLSFVTSNLFTANEVYYNSSSFNKSFFKLDLYDNKERRKRKAYLTLILQTTNKTEPIQINPLQTLDVNKPQYYMDYNGITDGFFIYWFRNQFIVNLTTFYMTAKFFNAKLGKFVTFINGNLQPANQFSVPNDSFYQQVNLDYSNYTYKYINNLNSPTNVVNWYEYVNPSE
jgi:hypothetical protein